MKKITFFLLATFFVVATHAGMIYVPTNATDNIKTGKATVAGTLGHLDAQTFLSLTPAKVQEMTGTKMTLSQKISLKMAQREVKRQLKKGKEVNMAEMGQKAGAGVNILWLLLGFFFSLLGVLIAYLTQQGSDDNRVRSAWIGAGIGLALWILIIIL